MSTPFLAEIRLVAFNFAPKGYAECNGQILAINQNQALFALLGTTYGGNGQTTFALPDLRGRTPIHWHGSFNLGQVAGEEVHTLATGEMPAHTHQVVGSVLRGDQPSPPGRVWAQPGVSGYATGNPDASMNPASITGAGGSQPHENMSPFLTINYVIALQGIFPSRN